MNQYFVNRLVLLIVLFSVSGKFFGNSQHTPVTESTSKNNSLIIGTGWASLGLRDMGISPLYYRGSHIFGNAGYLNSSDTYLSSINISILYGSVHPGIYPDLTDSEMNSLKAGGNYSYLRFAGIFAGGEGKLFVGGKLDSFLGHYKHNKYTNSANNQHFVTSLGFSGQASYPLDRNQNNFLLAFNLHIPFVAAIVRNGYAYIKPPGFLNHENGNVQSFFKSIDFQTLNNFFSLESVLSLEYRLKSDNILRISYRWDYFGHDNSNVLKSATHGIYLQTLLNL